MKTAVNKMGLISILLILITTVTVTAAQLPSAPVITKDDVKEDGGNVVISWKEGTNYFKDLSTGTQIDNFDNKSDWGIMPPVESAINDNTIHYQEGTGSMELTFSTNGTNLIKFLKPENYLNLSKGDGFSMWVYVQNATEVPFVLRLKFLTSNSSKGWSCNHCFYASLNSKYLVNGWNRINLAKSDFKAYNVTWDDLFNAVQIQTTSNLTTTPTKIYLDDLRFNANGRPVVMMTFDDGKYSVYENAKPILDANRQKATIFVIEKYVLDYWTEYILMGDLYVLNNLGWDISSHTEKHDHLLNMSEAEITASLRNSHEWLKGENFASNFLAYPFNEFNNTIVEIANKEGYVMARTVMNGTFEDSPSLLKNDDSLHSLLRLKTIEVNQNTKVEYLKSLVDRTKATNSTLQFLFHGIKDVPVISTDTSTEVFHEFSNYLKSENISVLTYSDYWNTITSVKPDGYVVEVNGVQKNVTTNLTYTVSYSECAVTKVFAVNGTTESTKISIAPYCPDAVQVIGVSDRENYSKPVEITLEANSPTSPQYTLSNKTGVIESKTYSNPIQVANEGEYVLTVGEKTYSFVIDMTLPTTTVLGVAEGQTYYTPAGVTINFERADNLSGVKATIYHLDEEEGNYTYQTGTGIVRTMVGSHMLTYKTYDWANNMIQGTVNFTISNPPTQSSGGGRGSSSSSGGGGGGASMGSGEDFNNIARFESRDGYLKAGIDTTFLFTTLNQGIYQIFLNGESQELGVRVENLRGKQNGTTDAPGNVLLYTNVMINSARIKDLSFTFKIDKNNITKPENVKAFVWNNGTWNQLDTKIVSAGGNNAYFQSASNPAKLTKLAISVVKAPDSASQSTMYSSPMEVQKLEPGVNTTAIVSANSPPKAPGFGVFIAILAMAMLYVRLKK